MQPRSARRWTSPTAPRSAAFLLSCIMQSGGMNELPRSDSMAKYLTSEALRTCNLPFQNVGAFHHCRLVSLPCAFCLQRSFSCYSSVFLSVPFSHNERISGHNLYPEPGDVSACPGPSELTPASQDTIGAVLHPAQLPHCDLTDAHNISVSLSRWKSTKYYRLSIETL